MRVVFEHITKQKTDFWLFGYNQAYDVNNTFYTEGTGYATFLDSNGQKLSGIDLSNYISHAYRIYPQNNTILLLGCL